MEHQILLTKVWKIELCNQKLRSFKPRIEGFEESEFPDQRSGNFEPLIQEFEESDFIAGSRRVYHKTSGGINIDVINEKLVRSNRPDNVSRSNDETSPE